MSTVLLSTIDSCCMFHVCQPPVNGKREVQQSFYIRTYTFPLPRFCSEAARRVATSNARSKYKHSVCKLTEGMAQGRKKGHTLTEPVRPMYHNYDSSRPNFYVQSREIFKFSRPTYWHHNLKLWICLPSQHIDRMLGRGNCGRWGGKGEGTCLLLSALLGRGQHLPFRWSYPQPLPLQRNRCLVLACCSQQTVRLLHNPSRHVSKK